MRAHAKVNLALRVGPPGAEGYHPLATVFQTIRLADRLIARPLQAGESTAGLPADVPLRLTVEGVPLPERNTVTHAVALLVDLLADRGATNLRPLAMRLRKRVPVGAGLGGGSSDAVAALSACARLWSQDGSLPPAEDLAVIARQVGADVPYFLRGGTALGTGRGDRIEPLADIPQQWLVIAAPCSVSVATGSAYAAFDEAAGWSALEPEIKGYNGRLDPGWMGNELHAPVVARFPDVERARRALADAGAGIAQMTGSGSASFGTFADRRSAHRVAAALRAAGFRAWACVTVSARQHAAALSLGV